MTEQYQYTPLPPRWFRVMRLRPAPFSRSAVKFDLVSAAISHAPPYVALSYTWDGQLSDRQVWCSGKSLFVTANAEAAMRNLRRAREDVYLWVDAICINQASLDEKSEQVAMMADIYRTAQNVAIWLGDLGFDSAVMARAMWEGWWQSLPEEGMEKGNGKKWLFHMFTPSPMVLRYYAGRIFCLINGRAKKRAKEVIHSHRYWTRIWTVQEVRLARSTIIYAAKTAPVPLGVYRAMRPIPTTNNMHLTDRPKETTDGTEFAFDLISKKATVPHDLIFALIAVYPDILQSVKVDYQQPLLQVFPDLTRRIITQADVWTVLYLTGFSVEIDRAGGAKRLPGLPSWCPDWHQLSNSDIDTVLRGIRYKQVSEYMFEEPDETAGPPNLAPASNDFPRLSVKARWIGRVGFSAETPIVPAATLDGRWVTGSLADVASAWIASLTTPPQDGFPVESLLDLRYEAAAIFLACTGLGRRPKESEIVPPDACTFPGFILRYWRPENSLRALVERPLFEFYYSTEQGPAIGVGAGQGVIPGDRIFCLSPLFGPLAKSFEGTALGFAVREQVGGSDTAVRDGGLGCAESGGL